MHRHHLFCPLVHLFMFSCCPFQEWARVSYNGKSPDVYPLVEIPAADHGFEKHFSFVCDTLLFFLSFPLACLCPLRIFPRTSYFPSLWSLWCFHNLAVLFLLLFVVCRFSLSAGHIFSMPKFIPIYWLYILIVWIRVSNSFSSPVGWGCRIHQFHLCRRIRLLNMYPG